MSNTIEQRANPCPHPFTVMENEVLKCSVCGTVLTVTIEQRAEAKYPGPYDGNRRYAYIAGATEERALTREMLIMAANRGHDFSDGNADTVHYDTIEDLIDAEFAQQPSPLEERVKELEELLNFAVSRIDKEKHPASIELINNALNPKHQ